MCMFLNSSIIKIVGIIVNELRELTANFLNNSGEVFIPINECNCSQRPLVTPKSPINFGETYLVFVSYF